MAASSLSPQQIQTFLDEFYDYERWYPAHFRIANKIGDEVPLALTPAQIKLFQAAEAQRARGVPVRVGVLKARQVHMSVGTAAYMARQVMFLPGQSCQVYAHEHKATKKIYRYYDQIYETYKTDAASPIRIYRRERTRIDEYMGFEGGGYIEFGSADNTKSGRSTPNRHLHLSEYAFWRDAGTLMTGMMASVPKDPGTTVIIETTANGAAGDFFDFYQRERDGSAGWKLIFYGWWEHPEYVKALDVPRPQFQESMDKEELALQQRFGLSLEQVYWRRWVIRTECETKVDRFRQEYPADPEEAFLTSGRPRFHYPDLAKQPVLKDAADGDLEQVRIGSQWQINFMPNDRGALRMFKRPEKGRLYVIGADTAEGIDAANSTVGSGDPDYSVAQVLDRESGEQVARYRARTHPTEFGRILADLGHCYNSAFIVPEVNSSGIATLAELQRQNYPLHQIYYRERQPDDRRATVIQEIGWKTTTLTRQQLISLLDQALRERAIYVRDDITLSELYRFVINAKGKAEAAQGAHDDCVIALGLAVVGLQSAPHTPLPSREDRRAVAGQYRTHRDRWRREDDD